MWAIEDPKAAKKASKLAILNLWPSFCPHFGPFYSFQSSYDLSMPCKVNVLVLFCLHNHFFSPVMDLQCSKWKIGLTIDDFVFFTSLHKCWPIIQLSELLRPTYALLSTFVVLFCLHSHFFSPFMDLQCSKWKIGRKIGDFVFLTFILPKFWRSFWPCLYH